MVDLAKLADFFMLRLDRSQLTRQLLQPCQLAHNLLIVNAQSRRIRLEPFGLLLFALARFLGGLTIFEAFLFDFVSFALVGYLILVRSQNNKSLLTRSKLILPDGSFRLS